MLKASITALLLLGISLWMSGCAASPAPVPDACGWLRPVILDPGYDLRLTSSEKRQILALDEKIVSFCPTVSR